MAPKLNPGEQIVFEGHPSWRSILDFYFKGLLVTALAALAAAGISALVASPHHVKSGVVVVVALVGVAVTLLVGFIRRVTTSYTITNRRLHIRRGIVSREIQETRLERVQNVNYRQNFLQRILQIGDVDFDTAGGGDFDFTFAGVAQPEQVVERVDQATGAAGSAAAGDHGLGETQPPAAEPPAAQ
jgi:uncharacterized membrane protein YdbT with pleckstrin-like domain